MGLPVHEPEAGRTRSGEFALGTFMALLALGLATLPGALRASEQVPLFAAWLTAWAGSSVLFAPFAGALRASWPPARPLRAVAAALLAAGGPLALLAELLKLATHHRALGAATFALVGLGVVLTILAFVWRGLGDAPSPRALRRLVWVAVGLSTALLFGLGLRAAAGGAARAALTLVFDGTLIVGSLALACALRRPRRIPSWVAALGWVAVLAGGLLATRAEPRAATVMRELAPVALGLASLRVD